jgi:hypothetical protein
MTLALTSIGAALLIVAGMLSEDKTKTKDRNLCLVIALACWLLAGIYYEIQHYLI